MWRSGANSRRPECALASAASSELEIDEIDRCALADLEDAERSEQRGHDRDHRYRAKQAVFHLVRGRDQRAGKPRNRHQLRFRDYAPKPVTYVNVRQTAGWQPNILLVRSQQSSPDRLLNSIRTAIQQIDRDQPLGVARTSDEIVALDQASRRQQMFLLAAFASLSLIMACLGVYAILAFAVELRRQEIGVRLALGAGTRDIVQMIAGDGMKLVGIGGVLGGLIAAACGRLLSASLYGVQPLDPVTWAAVFGILVLVAFAACLVPAQRAAQTSPYLALRS